MSELMKPGIEKHFVVLETDRTDIAPNEHFTLAGQKWFSITGSIGYHKVINVGGVEMRFPAGMVNSMDHPMPDNTVTAVPYSAWEEFYR